MAEPTTVNPQVTDAVTERSATAGSPEVARAAVEQSLAHAVSLAMHNAVAQQQQWFTLNAAVTAQSAATVLSVGGGGGGKGQPPVEALSETVEAVRAALDATAKGVPGAGAGEGDHGKW